MHYDLVRKLPLGKVLVEATRESMHQMPLYEYACKTCAHQFELLVRSSEAPACPACHGTALERKFSVFAAHTGGPPARAAAPGPCGTCGDPRGPGACSIN